MKTKHTPGHWVYAIPAHGWQFVCMNTVPFDTYLDAMDFKSTFKPVAQAYIMSVFATDIITPEDIMGAEQLPEGSGRPGQSIKDRMLDAGAEPSIAEVQRKLSRKAFDNERMIAEGPDMGKSEVMDEMMAEPQSWPWDYTTPQHTMPRLTIPWSYHQHNAIEGGVSLHPIDILNADGEVLFRVGDTSANLVMAVLIVTAVNNSSEVAQSEQDKLDEQYAEERANYGKMTEDERFRFKEENWPSEDWRYEVANDSTQLGYADWRHNQLVMWLEGF